MLQPLGLCSGAERQDMLRLGLPELVASSPYWPLELSEVQRGCRPTAGAAEALPNVSEERVVWHQELGLAGAVRGAHALVAGSVETF